MADLAQFVHGLDLSEIAESGLEREKSHPARLASFAALFYFILLFFFFFHACQEPVRRWCQLSQIFQELFGSERISRSLVWVTTLIFGGKCLEYLPMYLCGWIGIVLFLTTFSGRESKIADVLTSFYVTLDW